MTLLNKMYSYMEYDPDHSEGGYIVTVSVENIQKTYWPYWYDKMCKRFGQEHVDANYTFEHCLDDWIVVNWAWPS